MGMKRTKQLQSIVDRANGVLRNSNDGLRAERQAIHHFVSEVLLTAKCYRGFNHQYWNDQGYQEWLNAGKPDFPAKDRFIYGPSGDPTRTEIY